MYMRKARYELFRDYTDRMIKIEDDTDRSQYVIGWAEGWFSADMDLVSVGDTLADTFEVLYPQARGLGGMAYWL